MPKTRPDGSPLTPDDLEYWNQPYTYQAFPKMLYRGTTTTSGTIDTEKRVVATEAEENDAKADGWFDHPQAAVDAVNQAQRDQQELERQAAKRIKWKS